MEGDAEELAHRLTYMTAQERDEYNLFDVSKPFPRKDVGYAVGCAVYCHFWVEHLFCSKLNGRDSYKIPLGRYLSEDSREASCIKYRLCMFKRYNPESKSMTIGISYTSVEEIQEKFPGLTIKQLDEKIRKCE
jgi:hypothetical protein